MLFKIRALWANMMTFLVALVPVFKSCPPCPICMPKYAALFAFFGLELADYSQYLIPVMLLCMLISLGSIYYQTLKRQLTFYPLVIATSSCVFLLLFKYVFENTWGTYSMMLGLFVALIWHYHTLRNNQNCCDNKKPA